MTGSIRLALRANAFTVAVVALGVLLPFWLGPSQLSTAVFVLIAAIGAVGMNVLTGYTGQISLGHAFFLGVGAYTGALLGADQGLTALIWIPAAGVAAAICGALIGPSALRLRGLYLAIVTLALIFIGQHLFINIAGLTGGPEGRSFPAVQFGSFDFSPGKNLSIGGVVIDHDGLYYYLALVILLASMWFVSNVVASRSGRAMRSVRDRELVAAVLGVDLARTKLAAFIISSFLGGVSGALFASYLTFAQPSQWSLLLAIQFVAAIIVGGMGTTWGPLVGSIVIFALPQTLAALPLFGEPGGSGIPAAYAAQIMYGVLVIAFLVVEPRGVVGLGRRLAAVRPGSRAGLSHTPPHRFSA